MSELIIFCAGIDGLTLWLHGARPPASRIGSKSGYAHAIARCMGLERGARAVTLYELDPATANALRWLCRDPRSVAEALELVIEGEAREVWGRAREHSRAHRTTAEDAAMWWLWTAGARGGIGGFKGKHKLRPSVDGFIPSRGSLLERIGSFPAIEADVRVQDIRDVSPPPGSRVYFDPPYANTQGFGNELCRSDVISVARSVASSGSLVAVSEREPLPLTGATHHNLTTERRGQFRRSLTRSSEEWLTVLDGRVK